VVLAGDDLRRGEAQVDHDFSGAQASILRTAAWRKSSYSTPSGNCVEAAGLADGVALRDSRFPDGPALVFTTGAEWDAFLRSVRAGSFG
jgi:hypothetical protein